MPQDFPHPQCCISLLVLLLLYKNRRLRRWTCLLVVLRTTRPAIASHQLLSSVFFSFLCWTRRDIAVLLIFSYNILLWSFQSLFTFSHRCVVSLIVFALPSRSLSILLPGTPRFPSC